MASRSNKNRFRLDLFWFAVILLCAALLVADVGSSMASAWGALTASAPAYYVVGTGRR